MLILHMIAQHTAKVEQIQHLQLLVYPGEHLALQPVYH